MKTNWFFISIFLVFVMGCGAPSGGARAKETAKKTSNTKDSPSDVKPTVSPEKNEPTPAKQPLPDSLSESKDKKEKTTKNNGNDKNNAPGDTTNKTANTGTNTGAGSSSDSGQGSGTVTAGGTRATTNQVAVGGPKASMQGGVTPNSPATKSAPQTPVILGKDLDEENATPVVRMKRMNLENAKTDTKEAKKNSIDKEIYERVEENRFLSVKYSPFSTFSADVDTASYSNVRRFLNINSLPPKGAVRIEEMINYFPYQYSSPSQTESFSVNMELAQCPWNEENKLLRIGLKAREIPLQKRSPANLVFLIDISKSMGSPQKLPLLKNALRLLVQQLGEKDNVSVVAYAGQAGLSLPSHPGTKKERILKTLDHLYAAGLSNGEKGILLAYKIAREKYIPQGINRIFLCTDGNFSAGATSPDELISLVEEKAKAEKAIFLTILGFGRGNFDDSILKQISIKGKGNYGYIDHLKEAEKLLVEQMGGTLIPVARDVKFQVTFNPLYVDSYRLLGYEKRILYAEDFTEEEKSGAEIGSGQTITVLYEIVSAQGKNPEKNGAFKKEEMLIFKIGYKEMDQEKREELAFPCLYISKKWQTASEDFKFASAVVCFALLLKESRYKENSSFELAMQMAEEGKGKDLGGYREEFISLIKKAREIREGKNQ